MAARRRMPFRRRRRSRSETYTTLQCMPCVNVWADMPCSAPLIDMVELMSMRTPRGPADTTEVSNPSDRFVVVKGIKFQSFHSIDPLEVQRPEICDPCPDFAAFLIRIWEAIIVLPSLEATSNAPAYLPTLTSMLTQGGDLADRVLWKRLSILPYWGTNSSPGSNSFPANFSVTAHTAPEGAGPVVVKSRVRLDDRHALYYVRNFTHNVVVGVPVAGSDNCEDTTPDIGTVPVRNDSWFKIFYATRK